MGTTVEPATAWLTRPFCGVVADGFSREPYWSNGMGIVASVLTDETEAVAILQHVELQRGCLVVLKGNQLNVFRQIDPQVRLGDVLGFHCLPLRLHLGWKHNGSGVNDILKFVTDLDGLRGSRLHRQCKIIAHVKSCFKPGCTPLRVHVARQREIDISCFGCFCRCLRCGEHTGDKGAGGQARNCIAKNLLHL